MYHPPHQQPADDVREFAIFPRPVGYLEDEERAKLEEAKTAKDVLERLVFKMGLTISVQALGTTADNDRRFIMFITNRPRFGRIQAKPRPDFSHFYTDSSMAIALLGHIVKSVSVPQIILDHFNTNEYWRNVAVDCLATILMNLHDQDLYAKNAKRQIVIDSFWERRTHLFIKRYDNEHQNPATNVRVPVRTAIGSFCDKTVVLGSGETQPLKIFGASEFSWPMKPFYKTRLPHFGKGKHECLVKYKFFVEFCKKLGDDKMQLQGIDGDIVNEHGDFIAKRGLTFVLSISGWDWLINSRLVFTQDQKEPNAFVSEIEHKLPNLLLATLVKRLKVPKKLVLRCLYRDEEVRLSAVGLVAGAAKLMRHWEFKKEGEPSWEYPEFQSQLTEYWEENWEENNVLDVNHVDVSKEADEERKVASPQKKCRKEVQVDSDDEQDPLWKPRAAAGLDPGVVNTVARTPRSAAVKIHHLNTGDETSEEDANDHIEEEVNNNIEEVEEANVLSVEGWNATKMLVTRLTLSDICTLVTDQNLIDVCTGLFLHPQLAIEINETFGRSDDVSASLVRGRRTLLTVSFKRGTIIPEDLLIEAVRQIITSLGDKEIDEINRPSDEDESSDDSVDTAVDVRAEEPSEKKISHEENSEKQEERKQEDHTFAQD